MAALVRNQQGVVADHPEHVKTNELPPPVLIGSAH